MPRPSVRKLPGADVLQRHVDDGMTNVAIGEMYGVTGEAVRQALERAGISRPDSQPRIQYNLPWRMRVHHQRHRLARLLRNYEKQKRGLELPPSKATELEQWKHWMDGGNPKGLPLSVHYDLHREEGFYLKARQPGDYDYISPPVDSRA